MTSISAEQWQAQPLALRDAVLRQLQTERKAAAAGSPAEVLSAAAPRELMPASFEQQYLWQRQQLHGQRLGWSTALAPMLIEGLDESALLRALNTLQSKHASLRSHLVVREGELYQRLDAATSLPLGHAKLPRWRSRRALEAMVIKRQQMLVAEPFDAERGPLWRALLLRRGADAVLLLSMCSLICDGPSMGIVQFELLQLYKAYTENRKPEPELLNTPRQYTDYAVWQQQQRGSPQWAERVQWWREKLDGGPPNTAGFCGVAAEGTTRSFRQVIGRETGAAIDAYAAANNSSPFALMLTEFMALLAELDNTRDIWVTAPSATRPLPGSEMIVGNFMRQVLLRQQWPEQGDPLPLVQQTVSEALHYGDIPHQLIAEQQALHQRQAVNPYRYFFNYRQGESNSTASAQVAQQDQAFIDDKDQLLINREEHILLLMQENQSSRELNWMMRMDRFSEAQVREMMGEYLRRLLAKVNP